MHVGYPAGGAVRGASQRFERAGDVKRISGLLELVKEQQLVRKRIRRLRHGGRGSLRYLPQQGRDAFQGEVPLAR